MNYLEQFAAEWYDLQGYFVRTNVLVGPRAKGGYECELDVVALNPQRQQLVHLEASMDTSAWKIRERRFQKKFAAGRKYIPRLFSGLETPTEIDQIALLGFASRKNRSSLGGGRLLLVSELLQEIATALRSRSIANNAVPEDKPILRTIQFVASHRGIICGALLAGDGT